MVLLGPARRNADQRRLLLLQHFTVIGVRVLRAATLRCLLATLRVVVGDGNDFDAGEVAENHVEAVAVIPFARGADDARAMASVRRAELASDRPERDESRRADHHPPSSEHATSRVKWRSVYTDWFR